MDNSELVALSSSAYFSQSVPTRPTSPELREKDEIKHDYFQIVLLYQ